MYSRSGIAFGQMRHRYPMGGLDFSILNHDLTNAVGPAVEAVPGVFFNVPIGETAPEVDHTQVPVIGLGIGLVDPLVGMAENQILQAVACDLILRVHATVWPPHLVQGSMGDRMSTRLNYSQ